MKKVQLIKEMAERIKFEEGVTPKEFVRFLENVGVVYDQNYVEQIRYYMFDLASKKCGYLYEMCSLFVDTEPHKNLKGSEIYLLDAIDVFYCEECGVFVYDHKDYDFERTKIYCRKAPKWFRQGWKGTKDKTLSKDDFVKYYTRLYETSCFDGVGIDVYGKNLSEINYFDKSLELNYFKEEIVDGYIENCKSKNVA